ncbi:hypothetical protein J2X07_000534 [Fictibacillus barbaricus]|uniref:Uncharacterized protein n=1 Tax=Fictibacillus barbaricus TaxID=182136 RepID=A0ABU1TWM6_9BACL|nr:hypothetical protein [Fictibacillus barbaricus]
MKMIKKSYPLGMLFFAQEVSSIFEKQVDLDKKNQKVIKIPI